MTYFDPKTYNEEKLNAYDKAEIDFWRELFNKALENAEENYLESFESPDTAMTIIRKEILRVFRNHLIEHFEWSVKDYVISRLDSYAAENFRAEKSKISYPFTPDLRCIPTERLVEELKTRKETIGVVTDVSAVTLFVSLEKERKPWTF